MDGCAVGPGAIVVAENGVGTDLRGGPSASRAS